MQLPHTAEFGPQLFNALFPSLPVTITRCNAFPPKLRKVLRRYRPDDLPK